MKITCGTDIIEIERIKNAMERRENSFLHKIYTQKEIDYCESKKKQKYQHFAVRFAAKEAAFKALSSNIPNDDYWSKIEILNDENGRPFVHLEYSINELESIEISLSHCKEYAVANVVAIWN